MAGGVKKKSAKRVSAQRNKRSLDSGAQNRRTSARDDKSAKPAASARDDKSGATRELLYLFGIGEKTSSGIRVEGAEAIECGGLVCWVSRVDAKEYGEELQARMENLDWLAGASVRHQRVVGAIHDRTTVLPARFATLFVSEESLAADVMRRSQQLKADLRRVAGADEYGIKIFAVPKMAAPVVGDSGKDYLTRKSQMLRQTTPVTITAEVRQFIEKLQKLANNTAPGGSVSGGQKNLVWQGSLLVPRTARKRIEQVLAEFHQRYGDAFRVECTGPWPPYSFVTARGE